MARLLVICVALLVSACGFQLRGAVQLPYQSMYVNLPPASEIGALLKRQLRANGNLELLDSPERAEAVFQQVADARAKNILSINTQGLVREYQLALRYSFRITDAQGKELVPASQITITRDVTYNDSAVLAKAAEEQLLWRDMQNDLINQIMRRMGAAKPKAPAED